LFLNIACTLAVFDIAAPVDEKLEVKYHESFVRWVMVSDLAAPTIPSEMD